MAVRRHSWDLDTPRGLGRLVADAPADPVAALLLGHGAGGGIDAFDLHALATRLPAAGVAVARFEQPWRIAGKKVASPPAWLDEAWHPAVADIRSRWPRIPLYTGGRSAGARVACRCFDSSVAGVLALSFPLHPPRSPQKSRAAELTGVAGRVLVLQGERDPFGTPAEIAAALETASTIERVAVVEVAAAGHSLRPGKRSNPDAAADLIVDSVRAFVLDT